MFHCRSASFSLSALPVLDREFFSAAMFLTCCGHYMRTKMCKNGTQNSKINERGGPSVYNAITGKVNNGATQRSGEVQGEILDNFLEKHQTFDLDTAGGLGLTNKRRTCTFLLGVPGGVANIISSCFDNRENSC